MGLYVTTITFLSRTPVFKLYTARLALTEGHGEDDGYLNLGLGVVAST